MPARDYAKARLIMVLIAGLCCATESAATAQSQEYWSAASTTAISITENVEFSRSRIVFGNGASLEICWVVAGRGLTWAPGMREQPVQIFKITNPGNPKLMNGNTLCGPSTPSYLTVLEEPGAGSTQVFLTALTGAGTPTVNDYKERICAGFTYEMK
jgi:hypothetical protein